MARVPSASHRILSHARTRYLVWFVLCCSSLSLGFSPSLTSTTSHRLFTTTLSLRCIQYVNKRKTNDVHPIPVLKLPSTSPYLSMLQRFSQLCSGTVCVRWSHASSTPTPNRSGHSKVTFPQEPQKESPVAWTVECNLVSPSAVSVILIGQKYNIYLGVFPMPLSLALALVFSLR